jgi:hypothetical protein
MTCGDTLAAGHFYVLVRDRGRGPVVDVAVLPGLAAVILAEAAIAPR